MADIKISQLGEALAVTDSDVFPMTANGVTNKVKAQTIKSYMVDDLDVSDLQDTTITSVANEDGLVYNSTSQKWENKQIVQKNQISNRNLVDNGWFTINQRGQTTYTADGVYTFDRWKKWAGTISISGIVKTLAVDSGLGYGIITQALEDYSYLEGKKLTMSVMLSDDTVLSGTATFVNASTSVTFFNNFPVIMDFDSGSFRFVVYTDTTFKAIKLEFGTVSTLGMDTAPNFEQELAKCQRYYWRGHYAQYATVAEYDSSSSWTGIFIGVNAMRTTPVLTISGSIDYIAVGNETPWVAFSDLTVREAAGEYVLGGNRGVAGSPTAGYCFSTDAGGTTIELSADL